MSIQSNFNYFKANRDAIIKDHLNQFVVIKDESVIGYYTSEQEALKIMASKGFPLGSFNIQKCITAEEGRALYYTRRVAF